MPRGLVLSLVAVLATCAVTKQAPLSNEHGVNKLMTVSLIQSGLRTSRAKPAAEAVFLGADSQPDFAGQFEGLGRRIASAHAAAEAALSPGPGPSAANITGVVLNTIGDSYLFTSALFTNLLVLLSCMVGFCALRPYFPLVYQDNRRNENALALPEGHHLDGLFGWMYASWNLSTAEIERAAGLDAAMLVEFCNLCMRLLAMLLLPIVVVVAPLHWIAGHDDADDVLSQLGMANLEAGSALYWVHAMVVWYVVVITQHMLFQAKAAFVPRRTRWLKGLEVPRATTVLVEGIPARLRSDAKLQKYFADLFPSPGSVRSAYVVRDTTHLVRLRDRLDVENLRLTSARFLSNLLTATHQESNGSDIDRVRAAEAAVRSMEEKVERERLQIENAAATNCSKVFTSNGFVTFGSQQTAALALALRFTKDIDELVTSVPPAPGDVNWRDLLTDRDKQATGNACGQALILGLFWFFMPIVVLISSFTNLDALRFQMPLMEFICARYPHVQVALESVLATLALTLFMSLLPSVLMFIFHQFFRISSHNLRQHELQIWYFWFLIIFVVLVTAIGSSLLGFVRQIAQEPLSIFRTLAVSMPSASHFYLSWMVMQWATHGTALARLANLGKFMGLRALYGDEKAKALSEPEDQDYYGMGGRSARFTLNMVIAVVYCSLTPLIVPLTFLNFAISRLVYSYLFAFAETRKPDLGGVFYVTQLEHLQYGLLLYVVLMIGLLGQRAPGLGPMLVVVPCLWRLWCDRRHLQRALQWEALPYEEVATSTEDEKIAKGLVYRQPELDLPAERDAR